jgi:2-keto-4-pentenoate hydratase/2-oxohepta-3-ene-1,7-dioic acid hydratase in catechol pathway
MRLYRYRAPDGPAVGVVVDDRVVRLDIPDGSIDRVVAEGRLESVRAEAASATSVAVSPASGIGIGALAPLPAFERPGKIIGIGLNYRDHIVEQHLEMPARPTLFAKFSNAIVGDGQAIVRPEGTVALDLEVELGVVIGRRARRLPRAEAMEAVAGYLVVNDVTARDWQGNRAALPHGERGDGQWLRAKGSDTFFPIGAQFVTPDEIPDVRAVGLRSWRIPGHGPDAGRPILMQDGTTADMLHDIPALIEFVSRAITLEPGDILSTGTPAGVGVFRDPPVFLEPGDRVRCEVDLVGKVENPVVDWSDAPGAEAA